MKNVVRKLALVGMLTAGIVYSQDPIKHPIKLAGSAALSPDGKVLAFSWNDDIWMVSTEGGVAKRFTHNARNDYRLAFSPDGKRVAFNSDRNGRMNVFVAPIDGGDARQISFHSDGETLLEWAPTGDSVLYQGRRDQTGNHSLRLFTKTVTGTQPERLLFDAEVADGRFSPDGTKVLFTREGMNVYRKGYRGSRSSQVWLYDLKTKEFEKLIADEFENRFPLWKPDGSGFYFVSGKSGMMNLWEFSLKKSKRKQLTFYTDDAVLFPAISRDGSTIVFRRLFDFYRYRPGTGKKPKRIDVRTNADVFAKDTVLKLFKKATAVSYSRDKLEILLVVGGDLWVMDTLLKEPVRIVKSPHRVRDSFFAKDLSAVYYLLDDGVSSNVFKATRADDTKAWWENREFESTQVTQGKDRVSMVSLRTDGKKVLYCRGIGDLWLADANFDNAKKIYSSWSKPHYAWSHDGTWLAFSVSDNNFNRDIWIMPVDGSQKPFNVSRNPKRDGYPAWSPDGKILAWAGQNLDNSHDIHYLYLTKEKAAESARDRKLERARKLMAKRKTKKATASRPEQPAKSDDTPSKPAAGPAKKTADTEVAKPDKEPDAEKGKDEKKPVAEKPTPPKKKKTMVIDFDRILDRVRRIRTKDVNEFGLLWAPDSKRLLFSNRSGKLGTYQISFPDNFKPVLLHASAAHLWTWGPRGAIAYGIEKGMPAYLERNKLQTIPFSCMMKISRKNDNRLVFNSIWRTMRDSFYREDMNGCDWPKIWDKYLKLAQDVPDVAGFQRVINLMLGELNASHVGFYPTRSKPVTSDMWSIHTAHAGLVFDPDYAGPGLKVAAIIPDSPIFLSKQKVKVGEIVMEINGTAVGNDRDWVPVLNGPKNQVLQLMVKNDGGKLREVRVGSMTYGEIRAIRYRNRLRILEKHVEEKSDNRFAYVHVRVMDWSSFEKFQKQIFAHGFGKDGLVIDVRDNGGGFTADHLLTVLTQPNHAVTVPRGGGPGYPLDRSVYVYWNKPIVVLCNQNSYSNAEIFCHAIKTLKRGKIVGVQTAGGVISASSTKIADKGSLRLPFRGWYCLNDNKDMELNGAMPDHVIWPEPGDLVNGVDRQLDKAIEVLLKETK